MGKGRFIYFMNKFFYINLPSSEREGYMGGKRIFPPFMEVSGLGSCILLETVFRQNKT